MLVINEYNGKRFGHVQKRRRLPRKVTEDTQEKIERVKNNLFLALKNAIIRYNERP